MKTAFNTVYGTDDLICSFDGGNIFRPWNDSDCNTDRQTSTGWFHVDQGKVLRGRHCFQGMLTLTDCTAETGGFCCIPGSHLLHDEYIDAAPTEDNYFKIPNDLPALLQPQVLPRCRAGQ